jgi:hypothetical protein
LSGVPQIADVNYEALNGRGRSYEVIGRRTDAIAEGCKSGPLGELWVLSPRSNFVDKDRQNFVYRQRPAYGCGSPEMTRNMTVAVFPILLLLDVPQSSSDAPDLLGAGVLC